MFSSVPARRCDRVSQDPSHDGADKGDVDEGDVVEVRLVPECEILPSNIFIRSFDSFERTKKQIIRNYLLPSTVKTID